jgi:hypothetical protein
MLSSPKIAEMKAILAMLESSITAIDIATIVCDVQSPNTTCYHLAKAKLALCNADSELRAAIGEERRKITDDKLLAVRQYTAYLVEGTDY